MATTYNPHSKNLIVLSVKLRKANKWIDYIFPLNPASVTTNQASRVSATFTYAGKVFQNLGAGLKTLVIEGHTGYRLNPYKYGIQGDASTLAVSAAPGETAPGKALWLDLYSLIQLVKGENKFLTKNGTVTEDFSIENIEEIENVKVTIPDQGITYDVILQNDSFMRNREQPHLYKYKLDFIVIQEAFGPGRKRLVEADEALDTGTLVASITKQANLLTSIKKSFMAIPGIQTVATAYDDSVKFINDTVSRGNFFITSANSSINDLRRLERMSDALNDVTKNISLLRGTILQIKTFTDLQTAFYELTIRLKNIQSEMKLLRKTMLGEQQSLAFNINLTRLASISAPVTIAANKATVAQFTTDIRKLNSIPFPFPIDYVKEITVDSVTKINVFFKDRPSSLGITGLRIYATNDFGQGNDFVEAFSDTSAVLSTNYNTSGFSYNFVIEYDYTSFESIVQSRYKSLKRVAIANGETFDSILKKYAAAESNASRTYQAEVAYLNGIEYPYVVTSDNVNFDAYFGSYGYKIFTTTSEFSQYIYNIDTSTYPGPDMVLYDSTVADTNAFLLQQREVIDQIKTGAKFFVLLFKETYSNRCYAVFGITNSVTCGLFTADSYVICALEKGRSYDISTNVMFEIFSPYNATADLIDYYGQMDLFDSIVDPTIGLFDKNLTIVGSIYTQVVGSFTTGAYPFTNSTADKVFLSGDSTNSNYVILTNFTLAATGTISSYSITAFSVYKVLTDGQEILLPSFSDTFLSFTSAFLNEDTYKVDLDARFQYFDDLHVSILPRSDLGVGQGILDFKLIDGLGNVKQAIKNRLECPQGGLILHSDYGMPNLLGKKNTLENMILLRYNLYSQLVSDNRVKSANDIQIVDNGDAVKASAAIVLVNNDETIVTTSV